MEAYHISGGRPLRGEIAIHGAKNSVLPILAATVAVSGRCTLTNCPAISDVETALEILRHLGCEAERCGATVTVDSTGASRFDIPCCLMRRMRAAVIFLGALLARFGKAAITLPGGCVLGARPIDLHLAGLRRMGAQIEERGEQIICELPAPAPCTIALGFPSVGATENLLLAVTARPCSAMPQRSRRSAILPVSCVPAARTSETMTAFCGCAAVSCFTAVHILSCPTAWRPRPI